jgi:GNAT superfamily N-acetyltransferase
MSPPAQAPEQITLLQRLVRFDYGLSRDAAELIEPVEGGSLVLNPQTNLLWHANHLEVEATNLSASRLAELADELLGARGLRHRSVVPLDPAHGDRLAADFNDLGWLVERNLYMALRRPPERRGEPAAEVAREDIAPVRGAVGSREPDATAETIAQMLIRDARLDTVGAGRWFAGFHEGAPASACVLLEREGIGQVETVVTLPEARGRGLASGAVLAAVEASRRSGNELTFIVADGDDWPHRLYERLGFDPVGVAHAFLRKPPASGT